MDKQSLWLSVIVVGGVLAIANALRGAILLKRGDRPRAARSFSLAAAMLILMIAALIYQR